MDKHCAIEGTAYKLAPRPSTRPAHTCAQLVLCLHLTCSCKPLHCVVSHVVGSVAVFLPAAANLYIVWCPMW